MRLILRNLRYSFSEIKDSQRPSIVTTANQINQDKKLSVKYVKTSLNPLLLENRIKYFLQLKHKFGLIISSMQKPEITITLKNGKQIKGQAFVTTPFAVAKSISKHLTNEAVVAKIRYFHKYDSPFGKEIVNTEMEQNQIISSNDYELIDLNQPLEGDCTIQLLTFEDSIGKQVFWHSTAHLVGQCLQNNFGALLCHGPAIDNGFFYDSYMENHKILKINYEQIQKQVQKYCSQKQAFDRIVLTKSQALNMFSYNPFKAQLIEKKVPDNGLTTAYKCGSLIDLCMGPHIPSADKIKAFKITKNSSAYWLGNKQNDDLQRVYGISYPNQNQMSNYIKNQQQLSKRDHRNIGSQQKLFNFTNLSPGSALFFPHGTIIYNRLVELMRSQYRIRGYSEVISPNIYNAELWKTSGHYFKYYQNMFNIKDSGGELSLKPMNCPGHCLMFSHMQHSYRDLPIRMADFGVLHRNELHGSLTGLTRLRRFQQDDAHIFCRVDQIEQQILEVLDLIDYVYSVFNFKYTLELSTRPEKYLGELQDWDEAENQLKQALKIFGRQYRTNEGDGAFYGPKIDVKLFDVIGRQHQCGTIQLDFQLPARFNLQYRSKQVKEKQHQPVSSEHQSNVFVDKNEKKKHSNIQILQQKDRIQEMKKKDHEIEKKTDNQTVMQPFQNNQSLINNKSNNQSNQTLVQEDEDMTEMEARYAKVTPLKNGFTRPVILHRAVFGSLQRFIAILCEHTGGKWDFWISPRQIILISIGKQTTQFTQKVYNTLLLKGYAVEVDRTSDNFNKKIRNAQLASFNFIGVIGKEEMKKESINLRKRDDAKEMGLFSIDELLKLLSTLQPPKSQKRQELQRKSLLN